MKRLATLTGAAILAAAPAATAGLIDPTLDATLREAGPDDSVSALVFLDGQVDAVGMSAVMDAERLSLRHRHELVVTALQDMAAATQGDLLEHLAARRTAGAVARYHAFWISNVIHIEATPAEIRAIAARPDVDYVYHDYEMELVTPVEAEITDAGPLASGGPEPGVAAVRAPEVWEQLGITGDGVLVATLDTGVDGNHEALASRWRGVADPRYAGHPEWAWFDPVTNTTFPQAFGSHGTHTMGSVLGGAPGRQVGVAPGAQWIHAATIDRVSIARTVSDSLLAFEWLLDPDGDPETSWDVADTCSNSWRLVTGHGYPPCDETFWAHLDACEAAGMVIIFAAGNEGGGGLGRPPDRATDEYRTFAVAAVDANDPDWPIASFSSRGPTFCTPDGSEAIKPDIAGPGVNVISSTPGNSYGPSSGTSMSTPHLNGVVALMREANPDLAVNDIKQIIYDTAVDLGDPGEDNAYGWGMVDAFRAVEAAFCFNRAGDVDEDGEIDFDDLLSVISAWGPVEDCPPYVPADVDQNCVIDFGDLLLVLSNWGPCIPPRPMDDCVDAVTGGDGAYEYSTLNATTDGENLPPECDEGNGRTFRRDVWLRYRASCTGMATASVCDSDFNTKLAVYGTECGSDVIACSDDACGVDGTRSELSWPVTAGQEYLVRIGGRTHIGEGVLVLSCRP